MKVKMIYAGATAALLTLIVPLTAYANSSWHWLTTSPMTVLPFAVVATLAIETLMIQKMSGIGSLVKVTAVVSLANLLSFLAPYIVRAIRFSAVSGGFYLKGAFNKGPYYIVLTGYLLLTLLVEMPVVYFLLRQDAKKQGKLIASIALSNALTTALVAVCERLICIGQW